MVRIDINPEKNSFTPLDPYELPDEVTDTLVARGGLYISKAQVPKTQHDFGNLRHIKHESGDLSYLADQTKVYGNGESESTIHLVDTTPKGQLTGVGEVRFNPQSNDDYFKDKPFVGWTHTEKEYRSEGLGRRRLLVMKLAAAAEFGLTLHSDTLLAHDAATQIWKHMVDRGLAEEYKQSLASGGTTPRYKFK